MELKIARYECVDNTHIMYLRYFIFSEGKKKTRAVAVVKICQISQYTSL